MIIIFDYIRLYVVRCAVWQHLYKEREKYPWRNVNFGKVAS